MFISLREMSSDYHLKSTQLLSIFYGMDSEQLIKAISNSFCSETSTTLKLDFLVGWRGDSFHRFPKQALLTP